MGEKEEKSVTDRDLVFEFRIRFPHGLTNLMERYVGSGLKAVNELAKFGRSILEPSHEEPKELRKIKIK
jgi:hypothetical protein